MKNRRWIENELIPAWEHLDNPYQYEIEIHVGRLSPRHYVDRIAPELRESETQWGSLERVLSLLFSGERGLWFYAGWSDQASLYVRKVMQGDERLLSLFLNQIDDDRVEEYGDMLVGFTPSGADWIFIIEVSVEKHCFSVCVKARDPKHLQDVRDALEV